MSDNTHNMKQLITDQLIEEYQKRHTLLISEYEKCNASNVDVLREYRWEIKWLLREISRLQSMRQQEVQNIIDAYKDGDVLKHLYKDNDDYFTQTFKQ